MFRRKDRDHPQGAAPLRTIHQKLSGLSFVEPRVTPIADLLHSIRTSAPAWTDRRREPAHAQGARILAAEPEALVEHGQKIMDGTSSADVLGLIVTTNVDAQIADGFDAEDNEGMDSDNMPPLTQIVPAPMILPGAAYGRMAGHWNGTRLPNPKGPIMPHKKFAILNGTLKAKLGRLSSSFAGACPESSEGHGPQIHLSFQCHPGKEHADAHGNQGSPARRANHWRQAASASSRSHQSRRCHHLSGGLGTGRRSA